ncbi:FkbM family methyltransferase, partial [Xanthobacter wiegelii]|uniref:FkbM family methyltransferase n=1 Tax=Xanthobacter wiegelii TaxID=3119913 RepID=UPI00372CDA27
LQPEAQFNEFLNLADCHILPQHPAVKDLVLPSKLGGMLASGKQILVMADDGSELAEFLGRSCVRLIPGRADLLPATLRDISAQPSEEGEAARLAISEGLSAPGAMRIFERLLLGPAGGLGRQLGPDKRLIFRITLPTLTRTHSEALGGHCKGLSTIPNWLNAKRASPIRHSLSIRARTSMAETILRARKLWAGLTNPIYRGALRHKVGATIEHEAALGRFRFDTVVDVGANRGQFATFSRATFPGCRIISFEPLDEPASIFEAVFKGDPHVRLIRGAVAAQEANLHMNVTDHEDSSSFFDISEVQQKAFGSVVVKQTIVHCAPLTQFIGAGDLGTAALLKIDTQGYELEVLRGSVALLPAFKAIYCELSYVELYRGQPKASEVIGFLRDYGFGLTGVYNQVHLEGVALQADMLFEPMRPSLS